ncbi:unnamed protein product [Mytilus edulis]|uniref:Peptidase aspartic putative domain-containing protein n=1 Tax=Mytilus edulis TaxID=6550 RepID=A0A8S3TA11_MYTED|nr:unnamed protein product [Mytilus edulis]
MEDRMIIVPSSNTLETLRHLNTDIDIHYKNFCRRSEEYKSFITRSDTNESQQLISDYNEYFVTCVATYRKVNSEIKKKKADLVEQLSQVSSSNGSSKASSKRAKAEAEKTDITRFMYRKDFLLSRFTNFDDKPESYESWRASFQSVTRELGVTPFEEMDLLVKWLGTESSKFAKIIRAANAHDPPRCLQRIYDRLQERYVRCPLHKAGHTLNDCRGFRKYPIQDRQKFLREKRICFKCCETNEHFASNCTVNVKCAVCGNKRHATAMHIDRNTQNRTQADNEKPLAADGGEHSEDNVTVLCTTLVVTSGELPEIATLEVASAYSHLHRISSYLPPLDPSIKVELLIGRDIPEIHHVQEQITGDKGEPFAQRLALGWVVIGEVCLGKVHAPNKISVRKTHVLNDGRCTTFPLCENNIKIRDLKDDIFIRTTNDNKVGLSVEDRQFLSLMDTDFRKDDTGHCLFDPLGFVSPIVISGKILLREVVPPGTDWDEPLSSEHADRWNLWLVSLKSLGNFEIPRMITPESVSTAHHLEIHVFCDASEQAISSVAYLKYVKFRMRLLKRKFTI